MPAINSIPNLVEKENYCVMVPCIYDCASARAVELAGYKAMLLSGGEVGEIMGAIGENEMSEMELLFVASRICEFSPLPLVIDCGCFSPDPASMFRWSKKFVEAGAMALLVEDEEDVGREDFLKMIKAALCACEGSRCVVIARSNRPLKTQEQMDYVIDTLNAAMDLGAYMSMACGLNNTERARAIGRRVKGLKMYPDQNSHNGIPEVVNEEIYEWGFAMISFHYALKVAMAAMIEYGIKDLEAGNNLPSNEVKFYNGVSGHSAMPMFDYQGKLDRQSVYTGIRRIARVPGDDAE